MFEKYYPNYNLFISQLLQESGEPDMFCMDRLLINLARSDKATPDMLKVALPFLESLV